MTEQPAPPQAIPQWDVADRLRKSLRYAGIGTTEMAAYLGVSRQSVGNWMTGRIEPSQQTLRLWAMRTGVSYRWLACELPFA
jgi:transcriptional regulator with XRE-family HTH domain